MAKMPSALSETGRSPGGWLVLAECRCGFECRDDSEPWALPGGDSAGGRVSLGLPLGLSLCRRPKNLDVDDCRPLLSMALRRRRPRWHCECPCPCQC